MTIEIHDRYSATGRKPNGCDHCDGMGCAPIYPNDPDPKWRAAWERTSPKRVTLRDRVERQLKARLLGGKTFLLWSKRSDQCRFAKCPYCEGLDNG